MWPYFDDWGTGGGWGVGGVCPMLWMSVMVLLIILVALAVLLIGRGILAGKAGRDLPSSTARQIIDERYARGEIDKQQYEQMKNDIR